MNAHAHDIQRTFWQRAFDATLSEHLQFNKRSKNIFVAALVTANDAGANGTSPIHILSQMRKLHSNKDLMFSLFHLVKKIDDIVDEMDPDRRLGLGEAREGNTPCEFISNGEVCMPQYDIAMRKISQAGVLSYEEEVAFSNVYAVLIREGARASKLYQQTGDAQARRRITEANHRLAEVLGVHILQHCVATEAVRDLAKERGLLYGDICKHFPKAAKLSRMAEYIDDMRDVFIDLEHEIDTGIVAPNIVLCRLDERGALYDEQGELQREIREFVAANKQNPHVISYDAYPQSLRDTIDDLRNEYREHAFSLGPIHRDLMLTWWRVTEKEGLRSSANPDVVYKAQRNAAEVEKANATLEAAQ
ncbi:MAG: hypothetical protein JKY71_06240 [Alphaproteobacteria bacterium]|nr:hypothetical protein [Alphaproteobacteria bacterium]